MSAGHAGGGIPIRGASCACKLEARALPRPLTRALDLTSNNALGSLRSADHNARPAPAITENGVMTREVLLCGETCTRVLWRRRPPDGALIHELREKTESDSATTHQAAQLGGVRITRVLHDVHLTVLPRQGSTKERIMAQKPSLEMSSADDVIAPQDRGRMWYDFEIPTEFYKGLPGIKNKVRWVREHLPRAKRIKIGQRSAWYERDILEHIESEREENRARLLREAV